MSTADAASQTTATARYSIDNELVYELDAPCDFVFMIHAAKTARQRVIDERLQITPAVMAREHVDISGNRVLRLHAPAGPLALRYTAQVECDLVRDDPMAQEVPVSELPDDVWPHLLPTRYCESDILSSAALKIFGGLPPGRARVQAVSDWVHTNIEYRIGSSVATTTARDVFVQRAGVCRDFAHLSITFCRALNIPARLVCGYAIFDEPPPDFHAVFEAFIGGRWVVFDPTGMSPLDSLVRIATGRDAKDVAFATIFGPARMTSMKPCISPITVASSVGVGNVLRTDAALADAAVP